LPDIARLDLELAERYRSTFLVDPVLKRSMVSFQANKVAPAYRWFKFKEAFSASLISYLLSSQDITAGRLLDPFAGVGTALFSASAAGLDADGIELLPIGQQVIATRASLEGGLAPEDADALRRWLATRPWRECVPTSAISTLRITDGAYPPEAADAISRFVAASCSEDDRLQAILRLALLSVLESVSFTRKDGQYLRWDHRSGRRQGAKPFDKGPIPAFDRAIVAKLREMLGDLELGQQPATLFPSPQAHGTVRLFGGSCLDVLPTLPACHYDVVFTSPPYCNRYDYTRTYALELALLGVTEAGISELRQQMLSCTVENRSKDLLGMNPKWQAAIAAADEQELLQAILRYLQNQKALGTLNNSGIPRMVRGYFYEMACVVAECRRILKPKALLFMVNDNVRYAGASISVDTILSDIAQRLGFGVENILVLPNGKGNSSQQMGEHGRDVLRKCVYVWRRH
jgi:hypothetical protein